jgi:hypothetical protein
MLQKLWFLSCVDVSYTVDYLPMSQLEVPRSLFFN